MTDKKIVETDFTLVNFEGTTKSVGPIGPNFEILGTLGEGAMGIVYKARHLLLDKVVAIKVLKEEYSSHSRIFQRFQQEARTTSHLSHENIASVHDFGLTEGGHPFIVMDYIEGVTLSGLIEEMKVLPEDVALSIFQQIGRALLHAHENNVIHRDLKPSNIILQKRPSGEWHAKVVDFGIAKVMNESEDDHSPKLTQTGEIFGTPLYMSPEQCQGQKVDQRSDIYSLGCLMYECLMGKPPFSGDNTFALLMAQVSKPPTPFREANETARLSDALERVVFRAMEKEPEARYQAVKDLLNDLEAVSTGSATVAASNLYSKPRRAKTSKLVLFSIASFVLISTLSVVLLALPIIKLPQPAQVYPWTEAFRHGMGLRAIDERAAEAEIRQAMALAKGSGATPQLLADIQYELGVMLFLRDCSDHEAYQLLAQVARVEPQESLRHANTLEYLARLEIAESNRTFKAIQAGKKNGIGAAEIDRLTGEMEELQRLARTHADQAINIKVQVVGSVHSFVENAWRSKGQVLYALKLYPEAQEAFTKALSIAETLKLTDAEARRCLDIARCLKEQGKFGEAQAFYQRSIKASKELFGPEHKEVKQAVDEYNEFLKRHH
ncbi:MAG: serine/threonine protein kinase [Cyanobacteria bacterium SZAS LIN-3]|nr:serine/threonine protein kinase [Cyanobacteria bacterium SZAS LIN-3]